MQGFQRWLNVMAVVAVVAGLSAIVIKNLPSENSYQIVNVSYDPARELYEAISPQFIATYKTQSGRHLVVVQSHGGSSRQAQKFVSGEQAADVVTLGLAPGIDILRKRGLVAQGWAERLPNRTLQ